MSNKIYSIFLDDKKIGITYLEQADPSMGVVFGLINFIKLASPYDFLFEYCQEKGVILNINEPENKLLDTQNIEALRVFSEEGNKISGIAASIHGWNDGGFYIEIIGIAYPFYGEEFPHHIKAYQSQFE